MKIVICGYYGMHNIGDEAILQSLKGVLAKVFPNSEINVQGRGWLLPFGIRSFLRSIFKPSLWSKPYELIKSCEAFILGGGGLFTDEEGFFIPSFWALHGLIAVLFKKPVLCLGISIGPMNFFNKWLCKALFKKAKLITVRDKSSRDLLKEWGISSYELSDIAMLLSYEASGQEEKEQKYVVMCVRPFKNHDDFLYTKLAQLCDYLVEKYGLFIKLIPFQDGPNHDYGILNTIFDRTVHKTHIKVDQFYNDISKLINVLANAEVVIAMRLHAGILSVLANTPFVPLSYMQKVSDFWKEFSDIQPLKVENITIEALVKSFEEIWTNREEKRKIMKQICEKLVQKASQIEGLLKSL